jgi:hypothetical protein
MAAITSGSSASDEMVLVSRGELSKILTTMTQQNTNVRGKNIYSVVTLARSAGLPTDFIAKYIGDPLNYNIASFSDIEFFIDVCFEVFDHFVDAYGVTMLIKYIIEHSTMSTTESSRNDKYDI